ncbi:MAG: cytochrome c biogenesis CcdA family protein, partial [Streptosporangiaceae bacterium]
MIAERAPISESPPRAHPWLAAYAAVAVLGLAVFGSLLGGGDAVALDLAGASGRASGWLEPVAGAAPAVYAFGAGLLAAVNPCGFAMLPGFIAIYLGDDASDRRRLGSVLKVSASVTAGFVLLFGLVGALLGIAGSAIADALPVVSLLVGLAVVVAGACMLAGRRLTVPALERATGALAPALRQRNSAGYAAYGLAYGLTSLSCTLPIFLAVVGTSTAAGRWSAAVEQFL